MIRGVHTMFYSSEPEALRRFLREVLELPCHDIGEGWLIFDLPEADMGVHPAQSPQDPDAAPAGTQHVSFYCDDIAATVARLEAKGVEMTGPVVDQGWGLVSGFHMPGGVEVMLYQPRYSKGE